MTAVAPRQRPVGELLRQWREHRRMSQLELALQAEVSTRHLSFVETNRSKPSREMVLNLAERLELPLRERNRLLLAAGYAPVYTESMLDAPEMIAVREAVRQVLTGHEPYPAAAVDRAWNIVDVNASVGVFLAGAAKELLTPPVNALRLALHPHGMAPRIVNLGEWRSHLLGRLFRQIDLTGDGDLAALYRELKSYPGDDAEPEHELSGSGAIVVTLRIRHAGCELAFFSTVTTFGTPLDITVAELAIESFFPADADTASVMRGTDGRAATTG